MSLTKKISEILQKQIKDQLDDAQQLEAKHKANEAETEDEFFDMIDEEG